MKIVKKRLLLDVTKYTTDMAQRRMFSPDIVQSDAFIEMSLSTQALYFHLGMTADDDGFVNPRKIMRMVNAAEDDLKMLIVKRFVLPFENGVLVIKHWKVNNLVRKDWYKETQYKEQKNLLFVKDSGIYTFDGTQGKHFVNEPLTQVRLGKVNIPDSNESDLSIKEKKMYTYHSIDESGNTMRKQSSGKGKEVKARNAEIIKLGFLFEKMGEKSTGIKPDLSKAYFIIKNAKNVQGVTDFESLFKYFFSDAKLKPEQKVSLAFCCSPSYITQWKVNQKNKTVSQVEASSEIEL